MKATIEYGLRVVLPSGYKPILGEDCIGCGECAKYCQFDAIEMIPFTENGKEKKKAKMVLEKCFGCGVCETKCKRKNITLILDPEKGVPLNIKSLQQKQTSPH
jgi:formate hydrogenlyase subunit 6/NADH:ubiquinone oxidoreductase subunit I